VINKTEGKIGFREFISMIFIVLLIKSTDTTPTIFFKDGYHAGWMIPLISAAIMIIPFLATLLLLKKYNKGLIEIIYELTGKYLGFLIGMMLFVLMFSALIINARSYVDILSAMFFLRTPMIVLYLVLVIGMLFIAYRGLESISRTAWVILPSMQIVYFILIFTSQKETNFGYIYPMFGSGIENLLKSALVNSPIWADMFYFAIIFQFSRGYKEFKRTCLIGFVLVVLEFTVVMLIYIISFDYPSIVYLNYPLQELTRSIRFGIYLTNPEAFFLAFWVMGIVVKSSINLYFVAVTFAYTLKVKEFEPLMIPFAALTLIIGMIPENFIKTVFIYRRYLLNISWPFFLSLPIVMLAISTIKGNKKDETL
jgi:spore germination protein KB